VKAVREYVQGMPRYSARVIVWWTLVRSLQAAGLFQEAIPRETGYSGHAFEDRGRRELCENEAPVSSPLGERRDLQ
jgi:hypothetical protein